MDKKPLKIGDKVRILDGRALSKSEWFDNSWVSFMDKYIGREGSVDGVSGAGVRVVVDGDWWHYPPLGLELVEEYSRTDTDDNITEYKSTSVGIGNPSPLVKDTNPKDAVGTRKAPMSTVSAAVLAEVGVAMLEGALKYGRHNYRVAGVRASVYYDATMRHLYAWWDAGQDIDPDSGVHHVTKAIASLVVLRDAMINDKVTDDRPPSVPEDFFKGLQEQVNVIMDKYPVPVPAFIIETKDEPK